MSWSWSCREILAMSCYFLNSFFELFVIGDFFTRNGLNVFTYLHRVRNFDICRNILFGLSLGRPITFITTKLWCLVLENIDLIIVKKHHHLYTLSLAKNIYLHMYFRILFFIVIQIIVRLHLFPTLNDYRTRVVYRCTSYLFQCTFEL